MNRLFASLIAVAFIATVSFAEDKKEEKKGPQIAHMVYFKLKDGTKENREKLVAACKKYLEKHEGVVFFAAGVLAEDLKREVNDREWDVALNVVFETRAAHDKYQDAPDHLKFIAENKDGWAKVRVFDSEHTPTVKK